MTIQQYSILLFQHAPGAWYIIAAGCYAAFMYMCDVHEKWNNEIDPVETYDDFLKD